jgi:SAM-dependent methyltransferase
MPDKIFADPRLVSIYDDMDGERLDLDHYLALIKELKAKTVLDVGCGTGCLAVKLAQQGFQVTGIEPASASLEFARRKPNADQVRWILGDAISLPPMTVDLAIMTGNVAQVFLTDQSWLETIQAIRRVLRPGGHLIFEVRDPEQKAWLDWTREKTKTCVAIPGIGKVEAWCEVNKVSGEFVSFTWTYVFASDGQIIQSDSTLRFRSQGAILESLEKSGFIVNEIRDAPDRHGKEFVFIAVSP